MKQILFLLTIMTLCTHPQSVLIYRIESPQQIDIAKFTQELKYAIVEAERVICLLPKTSQDVFVKTFHRADTLEIGDVLTFLLRIRKQGIRTSVARFDDVENEEIRRAKTYYGPSVIIRKIILSDYSLDPSPNPNPNGLFPRSFGPPKEVIDKTRETTFIDSFFKGLGISVLLLSLVLLFGKIIKVLKAHKEPDKVVDQNFGFLKGVSGTSASALMNKTYVDKESFFKNKHVLNSCIFVIWFTITSSIMAQKSIYIDNTIKPELRQLVMQVVKNSAEIGNFYYLFGDSVRYVGKFIKFSDLDSVIAKNNNKDKQTSFQSLLQFTLKHKGLHIIISDGKPDFFNEDLPVYKVDTLNSAVGTPITHFGQPPVYTTLTWFPLLAVLLLVGIALLIILWLFRISSKKEKFIARVDKSVIDYKSITGEIKPLKLPVRINGSQNSLNIFETLSPDFRKYDLQIYKSAETLVIEEVQTLKNLTVENNYVIE
jgi:hypothetical protein